MKREIRNLGIMLVIPLLYYALLVGFSGKGNSPVTTPEYGSQTDTTKFINMIMNMSRGDGTHDDRWVLQNTDNYKELGFNAVHTYPQDDQMYGIFPSQLNSSQSGNIKNLISTVQDKNLKFFYEHVFFSYLCYSQRLIYEVPTANGNNTANNGFCYTNVTVAPSSDSGRSVLHTYPKDDHQPELLCSGIYENLQHSDFFGRQHDESDWYLKPMVRANLTGVDDNIPVFKIEIIKFNGEIDTSFVFNAFNFRYNGYYNGNYTEKFYELTTPLLRYFSGDTLTGINKGRNWTSLENSHVDFRIYTYGYVDFWFDKLTVDDFYANKLFDPLPSINYDYLIPNLLNITNNQSDLYSLYMDEVTYSQLPCVKYVMDKISAYNNGIKFMVSESNWMNFNHMRNKTFQHIPMLSYLHPRALNAFSYELCHFSETDTRCYVPAFAFNASDIDSRIPAAWKTNSAYQYNTVLQNNIFGDRNTSGGAGVPVQGSFIYQMAIARKNIDSCSPGTLLFANPQVYGQMWINSNSHLEGIIEPTNEEGGVQLMLSLAHGADGLLWYIYQSDPAAIKDCIKNLPDKNLSGRTYILTGLYGENEFYTEKKRIKNLYSQNKWEYYKNLNAKINKWIPTLDKIKWQDGFSTHSEETNHYYINDIRSIYRTPQGTFENGPSCLECDLVKYWEEAFFLPNDNTDNSKYLLMVNRRCSPETEGINAGDVRWLKIKFNPSGLGNFANWKIVNVENDSVINTFDKNSVNYYDAGLFQPGEGKLYKISPIVTDGGALVSNETISGNVNCNGKIISNGYNINISPGAAITFSENAGIEMNGGCFVCGVNADNADAVTLTGKTSSTFWGGVTLISCDSIGVYNTNISNIKANDTAKAFSIINSYKVHFRRNTFNANSNSGVIEAVYNNFSDDPIVFNIRECTFNMNQSGYPAINIISNASVTFPFVTEWCIFNSGNDTSNAIMLTEVTGGAIKNNSFNNFNKSVILISSAIDLYGNKILGSNNSQGIQCLSGSSASLSQSSGLYLGGLNYIRNYGTNASNIYSDNSNFNINAGQNDFDLNDLDNSKHFTCTFSGIEQLYVNAIKNCFHKDSITNIDAAHSVVWYSNQSSGVNFILSPYSCELTPPQDFAVFNSYGYQDTIYRTSGGEGSGFNPNKISNIEENVYKSLKDTININLRKRNYAVVEEKIKQLLTQFPDSLESAGMVQKLYMASLSLDNNGNKIGVLKTYLENIITSNQQNPNLTKRAFFYIQKCKVKLGNINRRWMDFSTL